METKTVLITGGLGYIGSHLAYSLIKQDYKVVIIDNKYNNYVDNIPGADIFIADICDTTYLKSIFDYYKIDCVIHLASLKNIRESESQYIKYYNQNITMLTSLLSASNCKNIIFMSSASVYNEGTCSILDKPAPKSVYGKTKLVCEQILEDVYNHDTEYNITTLRLFNPIGYSFKGIQQGSNLLDIVVQVLKGDRPYLTAYGNGTMVRDYIYIEDVVNYIITCISNKGYTLTNVGTGVGYTVNDIISLLPSTLPTKYTDKINTYESSTLVSDKGVPTTKNLKDIIKEILECNA